MGSPIQTTSYAVAITIVLISSICVRRIYFHAFSQVPGPFWAKITNAYSAYHATRRNTHVMIQSLHERYGTRTWPKSWHMKRLTVQDL